MPPEPLPWDRKDFFKERKHERSESPGSVVRWRDSSYHSSRDFSRWGSADFRRPPGHGEQGGWHLFSDDSGHGYALSRCTDKMLEEENCRLSAARGDGKYGRGSRENRSFNQRDWRGHSWETTNGSVNMSRRLPDVTSEQRSVDDMLTYPSHPHSDFADTWDRHGMKEQHDKMGVNNLGTGRRCDRESSLGSIDWRPLKWTRTGSLSSRGSGFSNSSSSRSVGGADSNETKTELQPKNATAVESHSGDAVACVTSAAPSEDTISRKKPRLNWGEGLAKYEKKKVEGPDVSVSKDGPTGNIEPCCSLGSSLADKSPKVTGFSDCASPATPSSVACSSSPGDDKLYGKAIIGDNDVSYMSGSPVLGSQNHLQRFPFNLEKLDTDSLTSLGSSLIELLPSDDLSSVDSSLARSTAMNKLLIWKADISKVLEVTETEIDSLENELKSLKSESGGHNAKSCEEHAQVTSMLSRPEPLQVVSSANPDVEMMPLSNKLRSVHVNGQEEDVDSPGSATSKFVQPSPLIKADSQCNRVGHDNYSGGLDVGESTSLKCLVPCSTREEASVSGCGDGTMSREVKHGMGATSGASLCSGTEDALYNAIMASNKDSANRACKVFDKLLPEGCCKIGSMGATSDLCSSSGVLVKEKVAERKRFAKFKERVITIKFKAFQHLWKEDMRLFSLRKCRPKSHKKLEVGFRTTNSSYQKHRSSIRSRFSYPAGNPSLVPTSEMVNFTSKLLSDSQVKVHKNTLKMPALILDEKEKMMSRFISSNGLVEDPLTFEKERAMINPWTLKEKEVFFEKLAACGKDFRKIASFLDHKTTADCVEFYYKNHKSDYSDKIKKKQNVDELGKLFPASSDLAASGTKWSCEMNASSLEILSAASMVAGHADGITINQKMRTCSFLLGAYGKIKTSKGEDSVLQRSGSFDMLGDERETVAADVLAGISGSFSSEAMSSCITSSTDPTECNRDRKCLQVNLVSKPLTPDVTQNVDDDTCSDESCGEMDPTDWTDEEKSAFLQAVSSSGKDFLIISQCVRTKSQDQCKVFFSKARKCLELDLVHAKPENVGSPLNDDANGDGSDTDDACVVETGSVTGIDKAGTKTDEGMPLSAPNAYHNGSNPEEARDMLTDLNKSKDFNGAEVGDEDMYNMVSDFCEMKDESNLGSSGDGNVLYSTEGSGSVSCQTAIILSASMDVGKDKANILGDVDTEASAEEIIVQRQVNCVAEDQMVSKDSAGGLGIEVEGEDLSLPRCLDDRDDKDEADAGGVVELKNSLSSTTLNASLLSVGNSCSGLALGTENQHQVSAGNSHFPALLTEISHLSATSLQDTGAFQCEKMASQDELSSTCDFQDSRERKCHTSSKNDDQHHHISGHPLDFVGPASILQGYPLQIPIKEEVNGDMICSSSTTELPLPTHKIEQTSDHYETKSQHSLDSEKTSRNGDVKLFGKILTNPSCTQKLNLSTKGNEENTMQHLKLSTKASSLKFTGHHSADGNSRVLKFDHNMGLENVPVRSYGYRDGNGIQTGFSSLPDSALLLAKYPAAFSNYPAYSTRLEQQSLHAFKSSEQHLNSASSFTRQHDSSNVGIDYQMFRSREGPRIQPFMVDVKPYQDVYSEMQRRNGFEAISSLQQQGRGMVGLNGVGRPGIQVGGTCSGVSDPVAAIKMHYSNSDQYGGQTGILGQDESWAGKGDLGR